MFFNYFLVLPQWKYQSILLPLHLMLKIKISDKQGYYFVIFLQKITHLEFMMKDS